MKPSKQTTWIDHALDAGMWIARWDDPTQYDDGPELAIATDEAIKGAGTRWNKGRAPVGSRIRVPGWWVADRLTESTGEPMLKHRFAHRLGIEGPSILVCKRCARAWAITSRGPKLWEGIRAHARLTACHLRIVKVSA